MLKEIAGDYFVNKNCNCAEAIICAANDVYDLKLSPEGLRAFGGFGGGCGSQSLCGAAAGCIGAIGAKHNKTVSRENKIVKVKSAKVIEEFNNAFGSELCSQIVPKYQTTRPLCLNVVQKAADILEELM